MEESDSITPISKGEPIGATALADEGDRTAKGRFRVGHSIKSPGNPNLGTLNRHRAAVIRKIKSKDIAKTIEIVKEISQDPKVSPATRLAACEQIFKLVGIYDSGINIEIAELYTHLGINRQPEID